MKAEDREALGLKARQWVPLKPINKRFIRPGQPSKEGSLKKKVGTTRQPFGVVRAVLRAVGIDIIKIYYIFFVGGRVGSLLTDVYYSETI